MGTGKPEKPQIYLSHAARSRRRMPRWLLALVLILAVGALCVIGGLLYLQHRGLRPMRQAASLFGPPFGGKERAQILVLGVDSEREPRRSDTMLVATVDLPRERVSLVSIPRDFRVEIPGHGTQKVNAAYALGGVNLARQVAEQILGLPMDYYVKITVPALVRLVDALGGVEIEVEKRMRYRDRSQRLFINLQPGMQLLNGEQAMGYVRFRMDALGDLTRIQRQHKFLKAVAERAVKGKNLARLPRVMGVFLKAVDTNLTVGDLRALEGFAKTLSPDAIHCATLPGNPVTVAGLSYLEPDWLALPKVIDDVVLGKPAVVEVVNGSGNTEAAVDAARRLEEDGCKVLHVTEAEGHPTATRVIDHFGRPDRAKELAGLIGTHWVVQARDGGESDFTVVVGADYVASTNQARQGS
jgi:LCP family protein required for cell wall assembly